MNSREKSIKIIQIENAKYSEMTVKEKSEKSPVWNEDESTTEKNLWNGGVIKKR